MPDPIDPPPIPNLPFVTLDQVGQYVLTPPAFGFLQALWARLQVVIAGGGGGGGMGDFVFSEIPVGAVDGANNTFVLANPPVGIALFVNGLLQNPGPDFTLAGSTITLTTPPIAGDIVLVNYSF